MHAMVAAASLLVAVTIVAPAASGQTPPAGQLVVLSTIDVTPDRYAEFGALQAEAMAAQRTGGQPWRETWHVGTFGRPYRVSVLRPMTAYAELDGPSFTVRGGGAGQAASINERARRMIAGQHITALRMRPDLGYGTRPAVMQVAVLTTMTVAPGRHAEFEAIVRDVVVPALKKAGEPYLGLSQVVMGGNPNEYVAWTLYDSFADVDAKGDPVLRALGPQAFASYRERLSGIVTAEERTLLRFNAALSFSGAASR